MLLRAPMLLHRTNVFLKAKAASSLPRLYRNYRGSSTSRTVRPPSRSALSSVFQSAGDYERATLARNTVDAYAGWEAEEKESFAQDLAENFGIDADAASRAVNNFSSTVEDSEEKNRQLRRALVPMWEDFFRTVLAEVPGGMAFLVKRESS